MFASLTKPPPTPPPVPHSPGDRTDLCVFDKAEADDPRTQSLDTCLNKVYLEILTGLTLVQGGWVRRGLDSYADESKRVSLPPTSIPRISLSTHTQLGVPPSPPPFQTRTFRCVPLTGLKLVHRGWAHTELLLLQLLLQPCGYGMPLGVGVGDLEIDITPLQTPATHTKPTFNSLTLLAVSPLSSSRP